MGSALMASCPLTYFGKLSSEGAPAQPSPLCPLLLPILLSPLQLPPIPCIPKLDLSPLLPGSYGDTHQQTPDSTSLSTRLFHLAAQNPDIPPTYSSNSLLLTGSLGTENLLWDKHGENLRGMVHWQVTVGWEDWTTKGFLGTEKGVTGALNPLTLPAQFPHPSANSKTYISRPECPG